MNSDSTGHNPTPNPTPSPAPTPTPDPPRKSSRFVLYGALLVMGASATYALLSAPPVPENNGFKAAPNSVSNQDAPVSQLSPSSTLSAPTSKSKPELVIFVPDDNGDLKKRIVPFDPRKMGAATGEPADVLATAAVRELMKATPETFPPSTKLVSPVSSKSGVPTLNFNRAFVDENFWQGSARTTAALDSLAMTVSEARKQALGNNTASAGVRIASEGQPIGALGEMDLREPYAPTEKAPPGSEP